MVRLYWSTELQDSAAGETHPHERKAQQLTRSKPMPRPSQSPRLRMEKKERVIAANAPNGAVAAGGAKKAATAGQRYGSLSYYDLLVGPEVRPALWISGPNPQLAASVFAEGLEGDVVVEITIDDQGNVVATSVLQSLAPAVDSAVLEALNQAHFVPAKRNGTPIASKQDVHYHFPR